MQSSAITKKTKTQPKHLPRYAGFLLEHMLDAFTRKQLELCFEQEIPLMKHFSFMTENELFNLLHLRSIETLTLLFQGKNEAQIQQSIKRWVSDKLDTESRYSNITDNITSLCFIQKQAFIHFIPNYKQDPKDIISVISEINEHIFKLESAAIKTFSILLENRLTQQTQLGEKFPEVLPFMVFAFDLTEYKPLYFNKKVTELLGHTKETIEAMGSDAIVRLIHPDDLASFIDHTNKSFSSIEDEIQVLECRIKDIEEQYHWTQCFITISKRDENQKALHLLGAALDITRQKEMENDLKYKTFLLQQSNANLEEFAYIASHDLKEPLRKISAFADRLLERHKDNLNDEGKIFLDKIVTSSMRMQAMITDLLTISRISSNKTFEECNLNNVLKESLKTLELIIEKKKARIECDPLPSIRVISAQVQQLFRHILDNSLKFCKQGMAPEIKISSRYIGDKEALELNLSSSKKYLRIDFTDNGIGFENQFAGKIFTIFQRLHGKNEYPGTGIGLTICKKVMDNHEGMICAQGKPGEGCIFSVIFPV